MAGRADVGEEVGRVTGRRPALGIHIHLNFGVQQGEWDEHGQTS